MSNRGLALLGVAAGAVALWLAPVAGQSPTLKTPWGTPDLQGIWENTVVTPFERAKELGTREFLTPQEVADREKDLARRSIRRDAFAAAQGVATHLQPRPHQSVRRPGGQFSASALSGEPAAHDWRVAAHRAVT